MQGDALAWFKWIHKISNLLRGTLSPETWNSFANHQVALFKLRQTVTVMDYQQQFKSLTNRVDGLQPTALLNCFIFGLRSDIQREIAVLQPTTLPQAIGMAKLLEAKFLDSKPNPPRFSRLTASQPQPPSLLGPGPPPSSLPIRCLNPAEMDARRAKGLCFNCDDKFHLGHRCKSKQFLLLLVDFDEPPPSSDLAILEPSLKEPDLVPKDAPLSVSISNYLALR